MQLSEFDAGYLLDIRNAAREALAFMDGVRYHQFVNNRGLLLIVQKEIEIMGEISKRLSAEFRLSHPEVPLKMMAGMRDVLVHDYAEVKHERLWLVVQDHLEPLVDQLTQLLRDAGVEDD
ncbi:MAG TPA: HepT-like ribonuclease domain-containing protein [Dehalococcoidia bacterium]